MFCKGGGFGGFGIGCGLSRVIGTARLEFFFHLELCPLNALSLIDHIYSINRRHALGRLSCEFPQIRLHFGAPIGWLQIAHSPLHLKHRVDVMRALQKAVAWTDSALLSDVNAVADFEICRDKPAALACISASVRKQVITVLIKSVLAVANSVTLFLFLHLLVNAHVGNAAAN